MAKPRSEEVGESYQVKEPMSCHYCWKFATVFRDAWLRDRWGGVTMSRLCIVCADKVEAAMGREQRYSRSRKGVYGTEKW